MADRVAAEDDRREALVALFRDVFKHELWDASEQLADIVEDNPDVVLDALDHKDVLRWLRAKAVKD